MSINNVRLAENPDPGAEAVGRPEAGFSAFVMIDHNGNDIYANT